MTPETLQRMREAAEAATKGRWVYRYHRELAVSNKCVWLASCGERGADYVNADEDGAHIALASPENVLALLDEVERLRELVYRIEDLAERWTNSADPVTECRGEELAEALS